MVNAHDGAMTLRVRPRVKCAFSINPRLYHGGGIFASICLRIEVALLLPGPQASFAARPMRVNTNALTGKAWEEAVQRLGKSLSAISERTLIAVSISEF